MKMNYSHLIFVFTIILASSSVSILAQQPYFGTGTNDCSNQDTSNSAFGYSCNGVNRSCQSYLTFRSQTPFNTVASISSLLGANPLQLSQLNSVSQNATFNTNQMVLVPVTCSCSGQFYQSNTSYVVRQDDSFLNIAMTTLQGLSTCQAINAENSEQANNLVPGSRINVPLRCACPTENQTDDGTRYLLTYLVASGEFVSFISDKFGVDFRETLAANSIPENAPTIFPNTTLLVPLLNPPLSSQVAGPSPPPPPSTTSTPPAVSVSESSSNKTWIYVVAGVVGGLVALCLLGVVIFILFFRKRQKKADPQFVSESFEAVEKPMNKKVEESEEFLESLSSIAQSVKVYKFEEVKAATENFSPTCLIKGSVYRGTINGDFAAIKKMSGDVSKEINLLSKINHFNLISLSGICFHDGHWYLVYEYAANGPLSDWICHHSGDQKSLSWAHRVQISLDVATGLNYLHSYASPPHVHKDLNGDNILLDGDLRAKIANFGLARSADGQEGEFALTRHIVGTQGYMAPEYLENGLVSPKLDVYAFGVLLLEILTGKEVSALYESSNTNLSEVLIPVLHDEDAKENLNNFIDPSLQGKYPAELAFAMFRLIGNCIMKDPSHRPSTDEIVQSVSRIMTATHSWEMSFSTSGTHKGVYQNFHWMPLTQQHTMGDFPLIFFISFTILASKVCAQQNYSGNTVMSCKGTNETETSASFLYSCNGEKLSCQSFLIFRSHSPYNSVSSISKLLSSDPDDIVHINNISRSKILDQNQEVIVPVNCSCSGQYYQANTSYIVQSKYDTYFLIANNTYQGLSTCSALVHENVYDALDLFPGLNLRVPLRCACPTRDQSRNGVKYLMTHLVTWRDNISSISAQFSVSSQSTAYANGLSENSVLYPFTTILIPLPKEPSSSQTRTIKSEHTEIFYPSRHKISYSGLFIGLGTGVSLAVLCFILFIVLKYKKENKRGQVLGNRSQGKQKRNLPEQVLESIVGEGQMIKVYEFEELVAATENFSPRKRFGNCVYKGVLRGKLLAIKEMQTDISKEVKFLAKINHFNLISLTGVCKYHQLSYLVFEFMENRSLKEWLFKDDNPEAQSWNCRIRIALDIADGLDYIHNFTAPAYVHNNISSDSILLNKHLRAKISNFSLARSANNEGEASSSMKFVKGNNGYLAPEYIATGQVTPKIDIYAFGIVLSEIITGKGAVFEQDGKEVFLSEIVLDSMDKESKMQEFIDPRLQVKHPLGYIIQQTDLVLRLVNLCVACLATKPESRPSAAEIISTLIKIQLDVQN